MPVDFVAGADPAGSPTAVQIAVDRLTRLVAPDMEPLLSEDDLSDLLNRNRRPDTAGRVPSDPDWTPTWDLDAAAADGWEVKAGRAAAGYRFTTDGNTFNRDQIHKACLDMAKLYRRGSGSARVHTDLPLGRREPVLPIP